MHLLKAFLSFKPPPPLGLKNIKAPGVDKALTVVYLLGELAFQVLSCIRLFPTFAFAHCITFLHNIVLVLCSICSLDLVICLHCRFINVTQRVFNHNKLKLNTIY